MNNSENNNNNTEQNHQNKSRIILEEEEKKNEGSDIIDDKKGVFYGFNKFFKYFGSEYSFTKFKINFSKSICTFGPDNSIFVVSYDGKYYQVGFDPINNSESYKIQEERF